MKLSKKISFQSFCADIVGETISPGWVVAYRALDGEALNPTEMELWRTMSGLEDYVPKDRRELVAVKGRRAQGSKTACKYLCYKVHTSDFRRYAAKGDRLHAVVIAQTRDTSKEIVSYFHAFYQLSPILHGEVAEIYKNSIELKSGFIISVQTCSFRAPRGITVPIALLDELGIWRVEGTDVDREVVRSLTPAQIQFPNRKLVMLGSPWVRQGVLFEAWQGRFEPTEDRLTLHCPTPTMNTSIPAEELERERVNDPQNFRREFLAEFLDDIDSFLADGDIAAAVQTGVHERPPKPAYSGSYLAAIDASGLSGKDRFTLAVGHRVARGSPENLVVEFDLLRGWSRAPVGEVVDEASEILKSYNLRTVVADQFGFSFLKELFALRGIDVSQRPFTSRSKPEILLHMKLALAQGRIRLLDHNESLRELRMLESKRTSGGHYQIGGPRGQRDDYAIVMALLAYESKAGNSSPGFIVIGKSVR